MREVVRSRETTAWECAKLAVETGRNASPLNQRPAAPAPAAAAAGSASPEAAAAGPAEQPVTSHAAAAAAGAAL